MDWKTAVTFYKIPKIYQDVQISSKEIHKSLRASAKRWIEMDSKPSLYLAGNTGSGKTYYAYCLLRGLVELGSPWQIFIRSDSLDEELLAGIKHGQESWVLEKFTAVPFLFIDDLGVERISDRLLRQYYTIIDTRMSNELTTIVTSNVEREKIADNIGDRIASRLEMAYQIKFPDKDLRKKLYNQEL